MPLEEVIKNFRLITRTQLESVLGDLQGKFLGDADIDMQRVDNEYLQAAVKTLLTPYKLPFAYPERYTVSQDLTAAIGFKLAAHLKRVGGFITFGKIDGSYQAVKDFFELNTEDTRLLKLEGWSREDFLRVHLYFLMRFLLRNKKNIGDKLKDIPGSTLNEFLIDEILLTVNAIIIHGIYLDILEEGDGNFLDDFILRLLIDIQNNYGDSASEGEICIACGMSKHAVYMNIHFQRDSNDAYVRIDNLGVGAPDPELDGKVFPVITLKTKKDNFANNRILVEYLKNTMSVALKDKAQPMIDAIYNFPDLPQIRSNEAEEMGYKSFPPQVVNNCVTENFMLGLSYRSSWIKNLSLIEWMMCEEINFGMRGFRTYVGVSLVDQENMSKRHEATIKAKHSEQIIDERFAGLEAIIADLAKKLEGVRAGTLAVESKEREQRIVWQLPNKNADYVERAGLYKGISGRFKKDERSDAVCILAGLGGVGKTQAALNYAHRAFRKYQVVLYFYAEKNLLLQYIDFAQHKEHGFGLDIKGLTAKQVAEKIYERLSSRKVLLVLDNVEKEEDVRYFLPQNYPNIDVLITSRNQVWGKIPVIPLDVFTQEETALYVGKYLPDEIEDDVSSLGKILGNLPLALSQAVAYIKETKVDIKTYLEYFKTNAKALLKTPGFKADGYFKEYTIALFNPKIEKKLLDNNTLYIGVNDEGLLVYVAINQEGSRVSGEVDANRLLAQLFDDYGDLIDHVKNGRVNEVRKWSDIILDTVLEQSQIHLKTVYTTWNIAMRAIANEKRPLETVKSKHALEVIWFSAYLSPDAIPNFIPTRWLKVTDQDISNARGVLRRYSLIDTVSIDKFKIHRLVQVVIRFQLQEESGNGIPVGFSIKEYLAQLSHFMVSQFPHWNDIRDKPECWPELEDLLPHVLVVREEIKDDPALANFRAQLTLNVTQCFHWRGYYTQSREWSIRSRKELEALPQQDSQTKAHIVEAIQLLGSGLTTAGDSEEALKHLKEAQIVYDSIPDPEKDQFWPIISYLHHEVGAALRVEGRYADACKAFEKSLEIQEANSKGLEERTSYTSVLNLYGRALFDLGDYPRARKVLERTLALKEKIHGTKEQSNVGLTLRELGTLLLSQGDYKGAEENLELAFKIHSGLYGADENPSAAFSQLALGDLRLEQGRYLEAKPLFESAFRIHAKNSGTEENALAAVALRELGRAHLALKDFGKARECLEKALRIQNLKYQNRPHLWKAMTLRELARLELVLGHITEARLKLKEAFNICKMVNENHPELAEIFFIAGQILLKEGKYSKAKGTFEEAVKLYTSACSPTHPKIAFIKRYISAAEAEVPTPPSSPPLASKTM